MKQFSYFVILGLIIFNACGNAPKSPAEKIADAVEQAINDAPAAGASSKVYDIKSGYIKYSMNEDMTHEIWFDDFGTLQREETSMMMMGEKYGNCAIVKDGYRYTYSFDETTGSKVKFAPVRAANYDKPTAREIEQYGIEIHKNEVVVGKDCKVYSIKQPVKSTVWVWNNIPLKSVTLFGGSEVKMVALELSESAVDASKFELPQGITFTEM